MLSHVSLHFSSTSCSHFFSLSLLATLLSFFSLLSFYSQVPHNLYLPRYWPVSSLLANKDNAYSQYAKNCSTAIFIYYKTSIKPKFVKETEVIKLQQKSYIRKCTHYNICTIYQYSHFSKAITIRHKGRQKALQNNSISFKCSTSSIDRPPRQANHQKSSEIKYTLY